MQCACLSVWFRIIKKYCLPFLTYTQVCINITSTAVYLLHVSFVLTSRIVRMYHYAIPRDYLTTLEKRITPWLWKYQQQWQCFLSNKYLYINSLLERIAQIATNDAKRAVFFLSFYIFVYDLFSLYFTESAEDAKKNHWLFAVSGPTEHCTIFHLPPAVPSSSIRGVTYQLFSIFLRFIPWKPYIFWMHII